MRKVLYIFCTVFLLSSCNVPAKFSLIDSEELIFNGLTSVHGKAVVENGAKKDLVVENALLTFRYKSRELATARLMLPIEVPAGEVSRVRYDLRLESESLSNLQTLQNRMETNPAQVFVDVTAHVCYGNIRRKIKMDGIPYLQIISNFTENKSSVNIGCASDIFASKLARCHSAFTIFGLLNVE